MSQFESAANKRRPRGEGQSPGLIALEIITMLLFLLFMVPFLLVLLNSAKTAKEIIFSPVSWPTNWKRPATGPSSQRSTCATP